MKKILIGLLGLILIPSLCLAGTVSRHTTYTTNSTVTATNLNGNFDNIVTVVNGGIENANIKAGANIAGSKLGTLATIVAGAGLIPVANIDTGITANKIVILDASAKLPAVDGSALTALPSGSTVQVVSDSSNATTQLSTDMIYDDTIPQITEGDEVLSVAITPTSATNNLLIRAVVNLGPANASLGMAALFQSGSNDAVNATVQFNANNSYYNIHILEYVMVAGTTSPITFSVRAGSPAGEVSYLNSNTGVGRKMGGATTSWLTVTEIQA
jgi:hypothetical protein